MTTTEFGFSAKNVHFTYLLQVYFFFVSRKVQLKMPYVVLSTQIRVENGPTVVGDEQADPELMEYLGAKLTTQLGNDFKEYRSSDPPRILLNKLELRGYKVIAMAGIGQTCIWTLNKPPEFE